MGIIAVQGLATVLGLVSGSPLVGVSPPRPPRWTQCADPFDVRGFRLHRQHIVILGILIICLAGWYRRRRITTINKAFIVQPGQQPYQPGYYPPQQGQPYGSPQPGQYGQWQPSPGTQYPPNAYTGEYNNGPGTYAPPPGGPPQTNYVSLAPTWLNGGSTLFEAPLLILTCPLCVLQGSRGSADLSWTPAGGPQAEPPYKRLRELNVIDSGIAVLTAHFFPLALL